jgi:predicted transposase YdaD
MTGAQALEAKGCREGRAEGRQEGQRELLRKMLEAKFGPLNEAAASALNQLTQPQIDAIATRFVTATSLAELGL